MSPSPHSHRLRAVAERYAPSLLAQGARAIAATGSAGRGDAEAGSDLDLWVVSDLEDTTHDVFDGIPITVMRVSEDRVFDLEVLSGVEVELTHVIEDPHGIFARVLARFAEHATEIREGNVLGALEGIEELVASANLGTPQGRLWAMRAAAHLACALRLYVDTGFMMPKMRHFRRQLPADAFSMLRDIQGIDDVSLGLARLIEASTSIAERMTAELRRVGSDPLPIATPRNALLKLEQGDVDDGVVLLRSFFEKSFVDQVLAAHPNISMVRFLVEYADREIRSYWETLHGLGSTTETLVRKADSTMVVLRTLLDRLGLDANHGIHPVDLNFTLAPP